VSFSALAAYESCPRRYYLERVLGVDIGRRSSWREAEDEPSPLERDLPLDQEEIDAGRDVGLLVHALLERVPAGEGRPAETVMRTAAEEWLLRSEAQLTPSGVERAVRLALAFWESPCAAEAAQPWASREVPFLFAQDGVVVSGVMDLLSKGEGLWHVIDYKTNALAGRTPAEAASAYDLQAAVYCLAALRAGAPAVQMDFVFLEHPRLPVTVVRGPESIPVLQRLLDRALEGFKGARFAQRRGSQCERCSVAEMCAVMASDVEAPMRQGDGIQ
jgi:ATP-dependent exoDNAse (exonuclease V) beta subunit